MIVFFLTSKPRKKTLRKKFPIFDPRLGYNKLDYTQELNISLCLTDVSDLNEFYELKKYLQNGFFSPSIH